MDGFFILAAERKFSDRTPNPPDSTDELVVVRRLRKRPESLNLNEITRASIEDASSSASSSRSERTSMPSAKRENAKRSERKESDLGFHVRVAYQTVALTSTLQIPGINGGRFGH